MASDLIVYGASDDLIETEGLLREPALASSSRPASEEREDGDG